MKPFLARGYAKRKLHTGNQSVQFDEEGEVERPLLYSTICVACLEAQERENKQKGHQYECNGTMSTGVKIPLRRSAPT